MPHRIGDSPRNGGFVDGVNGVINAVPIQNEPTGIHIEDGDIGNPFPLEGGKNLLYVQTAKAISVGVIFVRDSANVKVQIGS